MLRPGYNPKGARIKTDVEGVVVDRAFLAHITVAEADAVATSNTAVHAAINLADGATTKVTTAITNPKVPRALIVKGNAAGVAGDVVIKGTNYLDEAIEETIVAADAGAVSGTKAFKTVTEITVPARTAPGDTISIGFCDKLGLPYLLAHNTVIASYHDNALEGTPATVAVSATAIESNTVDLNTALNGKQVDIYVII
jgi:hypothetical protein